MKGLFERTMLDKCCRLSRKRGWAFGLEFFRASGCGDVRFPMVFVVYKE